MHVHAVTVAVSEVIMAQSDRWTVKILSLPIFSDEFSLALLKSPLANLAFVHAISMFRQVLSLWN